MILGKHAMDYCYSCFREVKKTLFGLCPFCGARFHYQNSFDCLMGGSVLAGRFIAGYSRGTRFVNSYLAFDWQTKKRVILWEFYPPLHAWREIGLPPVIYCGGGFGSGGPEDDPAYWLEKYEELDALTARLGADSGSAWFPRWISSFQENNTMYTVTEYVEGETLEEYLKNQGGSVSWLEALRLLAQPAEALARVHQMGSFHGALSPEKILLAKDGTARLLDTGLGACWNQYFLSAFGQTGPEYWEPYHVFLASREGPTMDVYSLACCFYRAVSGIVPGHPGSYEDAAGLPLPEERAGDIPSGMQELLLEALRFSPEVCTSVPEFWQALNASARQE